jgi:hypothetical protein
MRSWGRSQPRTAAVERRDGVEIGREQVAHRRRERRGDNLADAVAPFSGAARLGAGQIVLTRPRMGIDDAEGRRLFLQVGDDACKRRVLDDIGEISGVERVAVIHRLAA